MGHVLRGVLKNLVIIHRPNGFDWMNYALTKKNMYTYHHVQGKKNGGKVTIDNGAILTIWSHRFLHFLERTCPSAFLDLQSVFQEINRSKLPMSEELKNEIDTIIYNIFSGAYQFIQEVDLEKVYYSNYLKNYVHREKLKVLIK